MCQKRLKVRKVREILRLKEELGLSNRAIARACKISNSTVRDYLERAKKAGSSWSASEEMSKDDLYKFLFPRSGLPAKPLPNWEDVQHELSQEGVTLKLLW